MARRRRQLGYSKEQHRELADYATGFDFALRKFSEALDASDCKEAFNRYRDMAGEEVSENLNIYAANEGDERLPAKDRNRIVELDRHTTEAGDKFVFQCVVGGAFSGVKRRKNQR